MLYNHLRNDTDEFFEYIMLRKGSQIQIKHAV